MATPVKMPQLGESVVEGTVDRWLKAPGDAVEKLEPLLEIATDKIDTEVPAPATGVLLAVLAEQGETVQAGAVLAYIGAPGEAIPDDNPTDAEAGTEVNHVTDDDGPPLANSDDTATKPITQHPSRTIGNADDGQMVDARVEAHVETQPNAKPGGRAFVSPVVARIAAERDVDLRQVPGSGLGGRITKKDILAYLEQARAEPVAVKSVIVQPVTTQASVPANLGEDEELRPLSKMRRMIAQHMVQSKRTSPHVTTIMEADISAVVHHREAHKRAFAAKGAKLTFMPYFIQATVAGLRVVPEANSRYTDDGVVVRQRIHMGMAVALNKGLVVPVIRDADERNLQGLARAVIDLAVRAREGNLTPDDLYGGTFTITNHGTGGSLVGTPIINQPQAGILGLGAIEKRVMVRGDNRSLLPHVDDAIVIRPMCYLSFTFDHRILDGAGADRFLAVVKATLEDWPKK